MDDKKQLVVIRGLIVVFIAISAAIATLQYKQGVVFIAQLMGISWGALAGAFLAPFLYGLYWKRATKEAIWCCFIFSTAFMTLNMTIKSSFPVILQSSINAGAFTMLFGLVLVPVVSMITRTPDKKIVDNCFACYDETVSVPVRKSLGK